MSNPRRRHDEHIVGIRLIQSVNGEARMSGGMNDDGDQMFHSWEMFIDQHQIGTQDRMKCGGAQAALDSPAPSSSCTP